MVCTYTRVATNIFLDLQGQIAQIHIFPRTVQLCHFQSIVNRSTGLLFSLVNLVCNPVDHTFTRHNVWTLTPPNNNNLKPHNDKKTRTPHWLLIMVNGQHTLDQSFSLRMERLVSPRKKSNPSNKSNHP